MTQEYNIYLFDTAERHENLLPLTFTRPIADIRVGIDTIKEKWKRFLPGEYKYLPVEYLQEKFGEYPKTESIALFINGSVIPNEELIWQISSLKIQEALIYNEELIAFYGTYSSMMTGDFTSRPIQFELRKINHIFDIFLLNGIQINEDFRHITKGRESLPIDESNTIIGAKSNSEISQKIFIEKGAQVFGAILNVANGPIYIGENAEIMEGACVRGPLAICNDAKIRMGAKIYGGCTFGPFCKVGGEVDNTVFFGYSNKAHDGYLGNAVIGEWCNIGAGVVASNLKNDYSKIRVWNYHTHTFMRTDLQFCGAIIGDHTKVGVNCMLNTATVLGVGVNIHGSGFPRVFVPSFSEGSPGAGFTNVSISKFMQIAERAMSRRGITIDDTDRKIFDKVYQVASGLKNWPVSKSSIPT